MMPLAIGLAKNLGKRIGKAKHKAGEISGIYYFFDQKYLKASKMIRIYQKEKIENKKANNK
jgi:hypothetical protein